MKPARKTLPWRRLALGGGLIALLLLSFWANPTNPGCGSRGWLVVSGLLLSAWLVLIAGVAWRLTATAGCWQRALFLGFLGVLLLSFLLPPAALRGVLQLIVTIRTAGVPIPGTSSLAVFVHFSLFAWLTALLFWIRTDLHWLHGCGLLAGLGALTELLQKFVDGRQPSGEDVVTNLGGVLLATAIVAIGRQIQGDAKRRGRPCGSGGEAPQARDPLDHRRGQPRRAG